MGLPPSLIDCAASLRPQLPHHPRSFPEKEKSSFLSFLLRRQEGGKRERGSKFLGSGANFDPGRDSTNMCGVPHRLLFRIKLWVNSRGEHLRFGGRRRRRRRRRKRGWGERENFGDWILLLLPPPKAQTLFPPSPSHLDPPCFSVAFSQNDHASSSSPSQEKLFLAPRLSSPFSPLSPLHFSSNASPHSYRSLGRRRRGENFSVPRRKISM